MLTPASPRTHDRPGGDAGSASVEIAILGPFLVVVLLVRVRRPRQG